MKLMNIKTVMLRTLMKEKHISSSALAKAIGVSIRTVQRISSSQQDRTHSRVLRKIAKVLDVSVDTIAKVYSKQDMQRLYGNDDISW